MAVRRTRERQGAGHFPSSRHGCSEQAGPGVPATQITSCTELLFQQPGGQLPARGGLRKLSHWSVSNMAQLTHKPRS